MVSSTTASIVSKFVRAKSVLEGSATERMRERRERYEREGTIGQRCRMYTIARKIPFPLPGSVLPSISHVVVTAMEKRLGGVRRRFVCGQPARQPENIVALY